MITLGTRLGLLLAEPSHMASTELHLFGPLKNPFGLLHVYNSLAACSPSISRSPGPSPTMPITP
jgi:hypothetical protein